MLQEFFNTLGLETTRETATVIISLLLLLAFACMMLYFEARQSEKAKKLLESISTQRPKVKYVVPSQDNLEKALKDNFPIAYMNTRGKMSPVRLSDPAKEMIIRSLSKDMQEYLLSLVPR